MLQFVHVAFEIDTLLGVLEDASLFEVTRISLARTVPKTHKKHWNGHQSSPVEEMCSVSAIPEKKLANVVTSESSEDANCSLRVLHPNNHVQVVFFFVSEAILFTKASIFRV